MLKDVGCVPHLLTVTLTGSCVAHHCHTFRAEVLLCPGRYSGVGASSFLPQFHQPNLLSEFARAAQTKYNRLGGVSNRNLLSHRSEGWKFNIMVPADLDSFEASLLGLHVDTLCLRPDMVFSGVYPSLVSLCV